MITELNQLTLIHDCDFTYSEYFRLPRQRLNKYESGFRVTVCYDRLHFTLSLRSLLLLPQKLLLPLTVLRLMPHIFPQLLLLLLLLLREGGAILPPPIPSLLLSSLLSQLFLSPNVLLVHLSLLLHVGSMLLLRFVEDFAANLCRANCVGDSSFDLEGENGV